MRVDLANDGREQGIAVAGGAAILVLGFALLAIAHAVAEWSSDPASRAATIGALVLVSASLASMGWAAFTLLSATHARRRHLFCARRLLLCGLTLMASAGVLILALVLGDPFGELASSATMTAGVSVDLGHLLGAVICLVGGGVALIDAWDAFDDERNWGREIGVGR